MAIDACALLKDSEASAVTGMNYRPGYASTANGGFLCEWDAAAGILYLTVKVEPDAATAKADYSASQVYWRTGMIEPVPNFADMAAIVRAPTGAQTGGINVLAGTTFFEISYLKGTTPSDAQLKDAATLVKGRLP